MQTERIEDVEMVTMREEIARDASRKRIDNNLLGKRLGRGGRFGEYLESATGDKTIITFLMIIIMLFMLRNFCDKWAESEH